MLASRYICYSHIKALMTGYHSNHQHTSCASINVQNLPKWPKHGTVITPQHNCNLYGSTMITNQVVHNVQAT